MSESTLPAPPAAPQQPVSPAPPPPAEAAPFLPPSPAPATSLKPLLNPLQTLETPPASTIVEPPRSPNPINPAIDDQGRNVEFPTLTSAPESAARVAELPPATEVPVVAPLASSNGDVQANGHQQPLPVDVPSVDMGAEMAAEIKEFGDRSPLAIDAQAPPSPPPPRDEVPPVEAPGLIPPAVSTPTVIATEDDEMLGVPATGGTFPPAPTPAVAEPAPLPQAVIPSPAPVEAAPAPVPTPAPIAAPAAPAPPPPVAPVAAPQAAPVHPPLSVPMDVEGENDAAGEDEEMASQPPINSVIAPEANGHSAGVKRAGDELAGSDEKRRQTHSESPFQAAQAPAPVPAPTPVQAPPAYHAPPVAAPGPFYSAPPAHMAPAPVTYVPTQYVPPPPRDAGPTTPLTQTQHKHLLNAVRALKKSKDAINFLSPVDVVLFGIPHYVNIVKNPMDLGTVETKLIVSNPRGPPKDKSKMGNWDTSKGRYNSVSEVVQDVRQIWENTRMFNGADHLVSQMATRLEASFEKSLATLPAEPTYASPAPFVAPAAPAAGPSTAPARRASISQPPAPRRSSDNLDRPKREIHPPPSKELPYANDQARKKRRPDAQINWLSKQIRTFEAKNMDLAGPFLYPVEEIIAQIPDYSLVVKNPIDLNHIKLRINEGDYDDAKQLNADFRLMCKNAMTFNPATHDVHIAAARFLKLWEEKWKALPPKEVPASRSYSEDNLADDGAEAEDDEFEDDPTIIMLREQIETMQGKIEQIKAERRRNRPPKPVKKAKPPRKQSISQQIHRTSPGINGNGHAAPKKPRKSKDVSYHDDGAFAGEESEEEVTNISLTQKQELAEKITQVDGATLTKAIALIAASTGLDGDDEIELDIDSLPSRTIVQLYNLVCRGRTPKKGPGRPKQSGGSGAIPGKKPGRKPGKKHMNEQEEAERIKRMEAQLQNYDGGRGGMASASANMMRAIVRTTRRVRRIRRQGWGMSLGGRRVGGGGERKAMAAWCREGSRQ